MKLQEVEEVIACLGEQRRIFRYYKDRYCFDLLALEWQRLKLAQVKVSELKSGRFASFLAKPLVANALKRCGSGVLIADCFGPVDVVDELAFSLTLDRWGEGDRGWDQTSRNQCNLVLQLNFDGGHRNRYNCLVQPDNNQGPFEFFGHPVHQKGHKTLAWVRMDIDFVSNEVLIEEIQSDWLKRAKRALARVDRRRSSHPMATPKDVLRNVGGSYENLAIYVERELQPYFALWQEATLLAALRFVKDELGISTVYYHSFETGIKLKRVRGAPPRSMYTTLPKRFGFELTEQVPDMLAMHKSAKRYLKAIPGPTWFRLAL